MAEDFLAELGVNLLVLFLLNRSVLETQAHEASRKFSNRYKRIGQLAGEMGSMGGLHNRMGQTQEEGDHQWGATMWRNWSRLTYGYDQP